MAREDKEQVLAEIGFGQRVAEDEVEELAQYFVETDHWRRLYAGDLDIIYGPKGSGKSALYALLLVRSRSLFDRQILLTAAENPRGAPAFKDLVADPPTSEREFVGLWKLYLVSLVSDALDEHDVQNEWSRDLRETLAREGLVKGDRSLSSQLRSVLGYVRGALEGLEAGVEVDPHTGLPVGFKGKITFQEPAPGDETADYRSVDRLLSLADEALTQAGFSVWVLLDRLDIAFAESIELEQNALRALFKVYLDLLGLDAIELKIFLRSDIWRRITEGGFREASHITRSTTIDWDKRSLLNLVVSRAVQNTAIQDFYDVDPERVLRSTERQEEFFYRMFPEQVDVGKNKPVTFDWMLSRTTDATGENAPRELIHLLNSLREVQIRRYEVGEPEAEGETLFVRAAFKEALDEVSRARLEQTLYAEYPALRKPLEALRGEKTLQRPETLVAIWRCGEDTAEERAQELAKVGFFETRGSRDNPEFWVPFLYRDALEMVQGTAEL